MAARHHTRLTTPAVPQTVAHAAQGMQSPLYGDSEPRTIWFPRQFLAQVVREPGGLITLLTIALSAVKGGA